MPTSSTVASLRALVAARFPTAPQRPTSGAPTGVAGIDEALGGGLRTGRVTELVSAPGSGGQLVLARLLETTRLARPRIALIDAAGAFYPESVAPDHLRHLVWICPRDIEGCLAAADLLIRDGNYAVVVLDLRGVALRLLKRQPAGLWHRLHRAADTSPSALLVQTPAALLPAVPWRLTLGGTLGLSHEHTARDALAAVIPIEVSRGHAFSHLEARAS